MHSVGHGNLMGESPFDVAPATADDMTWLYTKRLVQGPAAARDIYDQIKLRAQGTCLFCGHGEAYTLDHYLPKHRHWALAVDPQNLIPSCAECNHRKGSSDSTDANGSLLHPYFDDLDGEVWLRAAVVPGPPLTFQFSVDPPRSWTPHLAARAKRHLEILALDRLYGAQAVQELGSVRQVLVDLLDSARPGSVRSHLRDVRQSRERYRPNSWQAAMYRAMEESDWFCDGGLRT